MKRRAFIGSAAAAGLGGVLAYGRWVEPRALDVTMHALRLAREGAADGVGPVGASGETVRIVQISDLHLGRVGEALGRLARRVDALAPDVLVFSGDTIDDARNLPLLDEMLPLFRSHAPKLGVMGNWEYQGGVSAERLGDTLARHGGELLVNRSVTLPVRGNELVVTGLDDWLRGRPDLPRALAGAPAAARDRGHHVVVAHCPAQRDDVEAAVGGGPPVPWMLSGHTHGGQIGLPGLRVTPFGSGAYVRGWYGGAGPRLYVSRGVGTSVVPLRIGSRPEVAVFDVELA